MKQPGKIILKRNIHFIFILTLSFFNAIGQSNAEYLKSHAVRVNNPEKLSDSVYNLLSPFQIIIMGEMHGTNEPVYIKH